MLSIHPNARNSRFPPSCPVYICDINENPAGIDAQGVVVEVGLVPSSKKDSFDTVFKVAVKCKNERGEIFRREEIVRPENLIYKNNCNVFLKVLNATDDDNTSPAKREAVVTGFHMLSCKNRTTKDRLRYIIQEVDGKKLVHNRVNPELVSFRNDDQAEDDVAIRSNATDPNVVTAKVTTPNYKTNSEVRKTQQIPNCINREQNEISSATYEENPSQRNHFQTQQPQRNVKHITDSFTTQNTHFGANIAREVKTEQINVQGDRSSIGEKRKHDAVETQAVNENRISSEKGSNPIESTHRVNVSNSSNKTQTHNTSRSLLSTSRIHSTVNDGSEIDIPLKSARSPRIGYEKVQRDDVSDKSNVTKGRVASRKNEYMYHFNLDTFDQNELEGENTRNTRFLYISKYFF